MPLAPQAYCVACAILTTVTVLRAPCCLAAQRSLSLWLIYDGRVRLAKCTEFMHPDCEPSRCQICCAGVDVRDGPGYRADKGAVVHAGVGKVSFQPEQLYTNVAALVGALLTARPKGLKGSGASSYLLSASVSSTMGSGGVPVSIPSLVQAAAVARSGRR